MQLMAVPDHFRIFCPTGIPLHSIAYTYGRSGLTGDVKLYSTQYNK